MTTAKKTSALRKRYGHAQIEIDEAERAELDAQLRALDSDPSRLSSWEDAKLRLGLGQQKARHRG